MGGSIHTKTHKVVANATSRLQRPRVQHHDNRDFEMFGKVKPCLATKIDQDYMISLSGSVETS